MEKTSYINEGQKQLNNTQFHEPTETDLTGEVIQRLTLMHMPCCKNVKFHKISAFI